MAPETEEATRWRVLLLLADRQEIQHVRVLLHTGAQLPELMVATSLQEAMVHGATGHLRLAVLDAGLCDALEREFAQHLLATTTGLQIVLVDDDVPQLPPLQARRLAYVRRGRLLSWVEAWALRQTQPVVS